MSPEPIASGLAPLTLEQISAYRRSFWSFGEMLRACYNDGWNGCHAHMRAALVESDLECDRLRELAEIQERIAAWQAEAFGDAQTIRGIDAHLARELQELTDAPEGQAAAEECADVLILLMGRAQVMGIDLLAEAERKLAINKARTWHKPDADGVISHVQEAR